MEFELDWTDGEKGNRNSYLTIQECCMIMKKRAENNTAKECLIAILGDRLTTTAPKYYIESPNAVLTQIRKRLTNRLKKRDPDAIKLMQEYGLLKKKS